MSAKTIVAVGALLICYTPMRGQQTQSGAPAQPTSSVLNRMGRNSPAAPVQQNQQNQQQARQAGQFPYPRQFPPDQQGAPAPVQSGGQAAAPAQQASPATGQAQNQPSLQAQPQIQPLPSGPALQPPNPPNISYANGELMVVANNSSLAEIMTGIERATGVRVEGTQPDAERVFGQFGPGSPRDVLNSLFNGSKYDFILTGSLDDPGGVQTIILSPHGTAAPNAPVAASQPTARPADNDDDEGTGFQPSISEAPQPAAPNVPSEAGPQPAQPQQQQVKTPEQLLQELQRLRQQQQQQQGQQPPPPPQNVPR